VTGPASEVSQPGYDTADRERWVAEAPKRPDRTAFQRDRARVLHSAALRRLAAKTQVVGPATDDFARNRLTHSLEVGQIGRELGQALGCDPDLVETACLAHDLGHPPFGHNGEEALDKAAEPCGGFEGNAQTLRILTRLEAKTFTADGHSAGLNLTRAALDAATKYPWPRRPGVRKFGVYADDIAVFRWLREPVADTPRETWTCLEAQVMDFADDVAYSVHDVEDGLFAGKIDLAFLSDSGEGSELVADVQSAYATDAALDELAERLAALQRLPWWRTHHDAGRRGLAALKTMTSELIGRFCTSTERATHEAYGGGQLTRYAARLMVPRETRLEVALLKGIAARYVMWTQAREAAQARERELIDELVDRLLAAAPEALDPPFRDDWRDAGDDAERLRVVVDQVASLTDASAVALHGALTGRMTRDARHGANPGAPSPQ
jgi:dGTPase